MATEGEDPPPPVATAEGGDGGEPKLSKNALKKKLKAEKAAKAKELRERATDGLREAREEGKRQAEEVEVIEARATSAAVAMFAREKSVDVCGGWRAFASSFLYLICLKAFC